MNVKYCVLSLFLCGSVTLRAMAVPYIHPPRDVPQKDHLNEGYWIDGKCDDGSTRRYCTAERVVTAVCCTVTVFVGGMVIWAAVQGETYQKEHFGS